MADQTKAELKKENEELKARVAELEGKKESQGAVLANIGKPPPR